MKKFLVLTILALVAFSTPSFSQRGDWLKRAMVLDNDPTYNARSTKLSNGRMTVYVDGYYRKIKQEGKNVDGIIVLGKDKHGVMWIANLSDYRMDVNLEWTANKKVIKKKELMDPWEISRLKDKDGQEVEKDIKYFKIINAFEH